MSLVFVDGDVHGSDTWHQRSSAAGIIADRLSLGTESAAEFPRRPS
jgi:hypothetical protein